MSWNPWVVFVAVLSLANSVPAIEASCVSTKVINGDACNNLRVEFDFSNCGKEAPAARTVRSQCVNQKAVSFVKSVDSIFIVTYGSPAAGAKEWQKLSLRREPRAPSGASVSSKSHTLISEDLSNKVNMAVVVPDVPANPSAVALPSIQIKPLGKTEEPAHLEPLPSTEVAKPESKPEKKTEPKAEPKTEPKVESVPVAAAEPVARALVVVPSVQASGFVDVYYLYNGNNPNVVTSPTASSPLPPNGVNKYHAFDTYHDTFNLALAEVSLKKENEKAGGRLDLGFGNTSYSMSNFDQASQNVLQGFVFFKLNPQWKFTAGKMFTHVGAEDPYAVENFNYSRSLLFTYAIPLWHTGVSLEASNESHSFTAGFHLYNGWAGVYENNRQKTLGARLSWAPKNEFRVTYNGLFGSESMNLDLPRQLHEANIKWEANANTSVVLEGVYGYQQSALNGGDVSWTAWMLAMKWNSGKYSLSPRVEMFNDLNGYAIEGLLGSRISSPLTAQNIMSATLTNAWEVSEGARTLFELREDISDQNVFLDQNNARSMSQITGTLAFLYQF